MGRGRRGTTPVAHNVGLLGEAHPSGLAPGERARLDAIWSRLATRATHPGDTLGRAEAARPAGAESSTDLRGVADSPTPPSTSLTSATPEDTHARAHVAEQMKRALSELTNGAGDDASFPGATRSGGALVKGVLAPPADTAGPTNDFRVDRKLASGGMGDVYYATQVGLDRVVALKRPQWKQLTSEHRVAAFVREGTVTGDLEHPGIVPVYANGTDRDGVPFYAMKLVKGVEWRHLIHPERAIERGDPDLADRVASRAGAMHLSDHVEILLRVCDAVAFAHSRHVVHRDLKPQNVMVGDFGEVQLMDWGLAVDVRDAPAATKALPRSLVATPAGTPAYMAPEMALAQNDRIDERTDVYLLGGILYELLTRRPPHHADDARNTLYLAAANRIVPPNEIAPDAPRGLVRIALRALATHPRDRHKSVEAFRDDIRTHLRHAQSVSISETAEKVLAGTKARPGAQSEARYVEYAEAVALFRQALELWHKNVPARIGLEQALTEFAQAAMDAGDLALAHAQLEELRRVLYDDEDEHLDDMRAEWQRLEKARRRRARYLWLATAAIVLLVGTLSAGAVFSYQRIRAERDDAHDARARAVANLELAERRRAEAERQRVRAEDNESLAERRRAEAEGHRTRAETNLGLAERERAEAQRQRRVALSNLAQVDVQRAMGRIAADRDYPRAALHVLNAIRTIDDGDASAERRLLSQIMQSSPTLSGRASFPARASALRVDAGGVSVLLESGVLWTRPARGEDERAPASPPARLAASGAAAFARWHGAWAICMRDGALVVDGAPLRPGVPRDARFACVTSDAHEERLAAGTADGRVLVFGVGPEPRSWLAHRGGVTALAFTPAGELLTTGADGMLAAWDASSGALRTSARAHAAFAGAIAVDAAGAAVATGGNDGTVRVWNVRDLSERATLAGHRREVGAVAFHPRGAIVASHAWDGTVRLWDTSASAAHVIATLHVQSECASLHLAFSADGEELYCVSSGRELLTWDVSERRDRTPDAWRDVRLADGVLIADAAGTLVVVGSDGALAIEAGAGDRPPRRIALPSRPLVVAPVPGDPTRLLAACRDGALRWCDTGEQAAHTGSEAFAASHQGAYLALGTAAGELLTVDLRATPRLAHAGFAPEVAGVAVSRDDASVASWNADGELTLYTRGERVYRGPLECGPLSAAVWVPGTRHLVAHAKGSDLAVVNAATGALVRTVRAHAAPIRCLATDPSGTWLATGGADGAVRVWDLAHVVATTVVPGAGRWVESVALDATCSRVTCLLDDGTLRRYHLPRPDTTSSPEELERAVSERLGIAVPARGTGN